jgi:hypothetical protein
MIDRIEAGALTLDLRHAAQLMPLRLRLGSSVAHGGSG